MATRLIIGLMSGTSVDAIDAVLVRVEGGGGRYCARVLAHMERRWPKRLRARLLAVMAPAVVTTQEICELNFLVAREFAGAVMDLLAAEKLAAVKVAALASHGQTICHLPPQAEKTTAKRVYSTLQIGDISALATWTGIKTVGNFRSADMAVGGQGAPLVPFADALLLSHARLTRCVQNIGGIANVTYLPPVGKAAASGREVMAFDTGPGNMLLDAAVTLGTQGRQTYDRDGRLAARGVLDEVLWARLRRHPYFGRRPPKSTGREEFGVSLARSIVESMKGRKGKIENCLHTLTRLTAWSIAEAYRRYLPRMPEEVIMCGGGVENPTLVRMLGEELGTVRLRRIDALGIPNKAKEAASFALLGAATLDGVPGNVPSATGARRCVVLGAVAG